MSRPQPYRIDWTIHPTDFDPLNDQLGTQFESIDQMFQTLFEDLNSRVATLTSEVTGVLPVINGGTNATGVTLGGVAYGASGAVTGAAYKFTASGVSGQVLLSNGTGAPAFGLVGLVTGITGILPIANGGTNSSGAPTLGGSAYGDGTSLLFTAAGATGNVLLSNTGAAPTWGKVLLTSGVTGILPIANGGTNGTGTPTAGGIVYGTGASYAITAAGTTGTVLLSNTGAAPTWGLVTLTSGVSGILPVANGGTGFSSLSGSRIPYGSGTLPFQSSISFTFDGTTLVIPGQIEFPAIQSASTGVNVLDDYEEGLWTPIITGSTSETGVTYSNQQGYYTKIGNVVHAHGTLGMSATGTIVGNVQIGGLPFASQNTTNFRATVPVNWSAMTTAFTLVQGLLVSGATVFTLRGATGATINLTTAVQPADLSATSLFTFGFSYLV